MPDEQQTPPTSGPHGETDRPGRGRSFGAVARAYAAFRPSYPDAAVDWALDPVLARPEPPRVLDLAAGTGKLTASLVARAGQLTAVEPDPEMLAVLRAGLGDRATALAGTAEEIPLPDRSVDAVLVGQAFHWFDERRAGTEIARVLRPGGVLAGLWNADDYSVDWVRGYHDAAAEERDVLAVPAGGDRPDLLADHPDFAPCARAEFGHSRRLTVDGLIDVLGTHSWALVSTPERREEVFRRIRGYLATRRGLVGPDGSFELPLRTAVVRTLRR
jgi:SAM-dependent methyltransferase